MSLRSNIADELKKTPVAAISGAAGVVVALISLAVGLTQNRDTLPGGAATTETPQMIIPLFTGNLFILIAYFLATTIVASLLLRAIARKHDLTALFASVPLIALTNFSVILLIYLLPPRPLSVQLFQSAHDLVFYGSAAIVIVFCGKAVLADIASTNVPKKAASEVAQAESEAQSSSSNSSNGGVFLFIAIILLVLWSWLVFAGQKRLTRTLLPEITHPVDVKQVDATVSAPLLLGVKSRPRP